MKIKKPTVVGVLSTVPVVGYGVLFAFACIAYLMVGNWPHYSHPDPKELSLPIVHGFVRLFMYVSWLLILGNPLVYVVSAVGWKNKNAMERLRFLRHIGIFAIGAGLWAFEFYQAHRTNEGLMSWVLD